MAAGERTEAGSEGHVRCGMASRRAAVEALMSVSDLLGVGAVGVDLESAAGR